MIFLRRIGFWALVLGLGLWSLFPLWYAFVTSFATGSEMFQANFWPPHVDLWNYAEVLGRGHMLRALVNSALVAAVTVLAVLALGLFAAHAFARTAFRGRKVLLFSVLGASFFPQVAVLAGFYELLVKAGLYNTLAAVGVSYLLILLPQTVWLLTAYMRAIPAEVEDMAVIDGASPVQIVLRVMLPLLWPGMVASGLLAALAAWNEFVFAFTFTMTEGQRTAPVAISLLWGYTPHDTPWGDMMAACVLATLPPALLVLWLQRRMVSGLSLV